MTRRREAIPNYSQRRTTVLLLTTDAGLVRLARSILQPGRRVSAGAPFGAVPRAAAAADVVVVELDAVNRKTLDAIRRAWPESALIVVCPQRREVDCIAALDMDADYLARPFREADLAARVHVAERRRFAGRGRPRFYRNGLLAFDLFSGSLSLDGRTVALSPSEAALLAHLAERAGCVVSYARLLGDGGSVLLPRSRHALRSTVMRLRRKIEREPLRPRILLAEIGVGYRLAPPTPELSRRGRDALSDDQQQA